MKVGVGAKVVYARTYEISKNALSYLGLPGPITLSRYYFLREEGRSVRSGVVRI